VKKAVIIVAAGSGSRMGGELPKQYLQLLGRPLIVHTLERFQRFDPEMKLVVVLAPAHKELWEQMAASYEIAGGVTLALGGPTRYDSVKSGLKQIDKETLIGIHDAARPLVSQDTLIRCYDAALRKGSGIPVVEMDESVRMLDAEGGSVHMDRNSLKRVQTPQVFRSNRIKKVYQQPYNQAFTDDASVYETAYGPPSLVEGNRENIKLTTPIDIKLAQLLIDSLE
jgi:2-C-methyl-D-erythritol 4-phosphate cytidylyltransferase